MVFPNANLNFRKADGVGEQTTGRVEVVKVGGDRPISEPAVTVLDHDGDVCVEGTPMTCTVALERI